MGGERREARGCNPIFDSFGGDSGRDSASRISLPKAGALFSKASESVFLTAGVVGP